MGNYCVMWYLVNVCGFMGCVSVVGLKKKKIFVFVGIVYKNDGGIIWWYYVLLLGCSYWLLLINVVNILNIYLLKGYDFYDWLVN